MLHEAARGRTTELQGENVDKEDGQGCEYDTDWYFYFHLSLAACEKLRICFPVYASVGRGLLGMAIRNGVMISAGGTAILALPGGDPHPVSGGYRY